jgi:hypothetical protein
MMRRSASRWGRIGLLGLVPFLLAGPLGAEGRLRLLVEGEAGVRDDGGYGQQQDPSLRQDQAIGRAGLNLQLSYALERLNLALGYSPYYEETLSQPRVSGTTHRLDFGLVGDLSRTLKLDVRDRLLKTPNLDLYSPATGSAGPGTTAVTRRGDQLGNTFDVNFTQAFSRRASLVLGATHDLRKYQDAGLFDSESLGGRLGAAFEVGRAQRIEAAAGIFRYDYKERGDSDVRTLGLAWATDIGRDNHLRLEAGSYSVDSTVRQPGIPDASESVSDSGWRGSLQFAQERRLFHWNLGASHDISPGSGLGRAVTADNGFVGISTVVRRNLTLGLDGSASRQRNLPDDRSSAVDPENRALTEFAAATARFGWTFSPAFRLDGGYSRVWQRSQVPEFANLSYSRYFLGLAFRLYSTGETPVEPQDLGRTSTDDEKSDSQ